MSYVRLKTWIKEYLTFQDLNAEIAHIYAGLNDLEGKKVNILDCVSTNTPLKIVKRDADGNFAGNLQGNASNGFQCGDFKPWAFSAIPDGWLLLNGETIGDSLSGATARANADVQNLFVMIWNDYDNTLCPIYDYNGVAALRGMSALDDFNAHKRLSLMDWRSRTIIGLDNMGGISADIVTNANADILGGKFGEENHLLTINEMPSHNHNGVTGNDSPDHSHGIGYLSGGEGYSAYSTTSANNSTPKYTGGASNRHTHSISSQGGNVAHNIMQPSVALNYIIKY